MKQLFDLIEASLEDLYTKTDRIKAWAGSKLPSLKGFNKDTHPRIYGLWDDLCCVIYFTLFRLILTVVVLPVVLVVLPVLCLFKLLKNKLKSKKETV